MLGAFDSYVIDKQEEREELQAWGEYRAHGGKMDFTAWQEYQANKLAEKVE